MSGRNGNRCAESVHCSDFVQGELATVVRADFEAHLLDGCAQCGSELERLRRAAALLDLAAEDERPPAALRERVLARRGSMRSGGLEFADREVVGASAAEPSIAIVAEGDSPWQPTDVDGVELRVLAHDRAARRVTSLVRIAPGATFPSHLHRQREETLVLEGDLSFGERTMAAGDFAAAEAGSVHPELTSRGGCVALVISSIDDERLQ